MKQNQSIKQSIRKQQLW